MGCWFISVLSFWGHSLIMTLTRQHQRGSQPITTHHMSFTPLSDLIWTAAFPAVSEWSSARSLRGHWTALCVCVDRCVVPLLLLWVLLSLRHEDAMRLSVYIGAFYCTATCWFPHSLSPLASLSLYFLSSSLRLFLTTSLPLSLFIFLPVTLCIRATQEFVFMLKFSLKVTFFKSRELWLWLALSMS